MGAWGLCRRAGKEEPEVKAAPKCQNHPDIAALRPAHLVDSGAGRAEPGASLCWLCLCYPGSAVWPLPLCACRGTMQPESSVATAADLPGRRGPQYVECPSAADVGKWKEQKKKKTQPGLVPATGEPAACKTGTAVSTLADRHVPPLP
ncbi:hypothetical protein NDU88_001946 [Pleurodeles waltl]|uniref:Uncharacterized protein n=1 Tax=Pleurodeles waltl TaxID=8319 RepID=A0AAV7UU51_PLEWA|nr:hypothetical protein NDU88_001946 [Pleurodeles waltl]